MARIVNVMSRSLAGYADWVGAKLTFPASGEELFRHFTNPTSSSAGSLYSRLYFRPLVFGSVKPYFAAGRPRLVATTNVGEDAVSLTCAVKELFADAWLLTGMTGSESSG